MPPLPGRHGGGIGPKPDPLAPRFGFRLRIRLPVVLRLFLLIFLVVPGEAGANLHEARIDGLRAGLDLAGEDDPDDAAVSVPLRPFDADRLAIDQGGEGLLGLLAEGLPLLRGIDSGKPYLVLLVRRIQDGDGIPIRHADDTADERLRGSSRREGKENKTQQDGECFPVSSRASRSVAWCGVPLTPRRNQMESVHDRSPRNVYEHVTAEIIRAIESGLSGEYKMPWHRDTAQGLPMNVYTGRHYHGYNTLSLWAASLLKGYPTPCWATYRQWNEIGAQVRRGEKGSPILFYKELSLGEEADPDADPVPERRRVIAHLSHVFNGAQVDGWPAPGLPYIDKTDRIGEVERFIGAIGASIRYGGPHAYYSRVSDHIQMPEPSSFVGTETRSPTESFYAVLLHEHVHWSGHPSRLYRDLSGKFGERAYAMEELVAELGAAFLCAELRIADAPRKDHALYLRSWLPVLKEKPTVLAIAASAATKACQYLRERAGVEKEAA